MCLQKVSPCVVLFWRINHCRLREITMCRRFLSHEENQEENDETQPGNKPDFSVINSLYSSSEEIQKIKAEELTRFMKNIANLEKSHVCQLILVLSGTKSGTLLKFDVNSIISRVHQLVDQMTIEEMSYTFHYLNKLGVSINHQTMQLMSDKITEKLNQSDDFPLSHLSHFTSGLSSDKGLYSSFIAVSTIPQITRQLEKCTNVENLHLIAQCFTNISHIISLTLLEDFKRKVEQFLDQDLLNEESPKPILKIVNFLNYPHWSFRNTFLIRRLLLQIEDNIPFLETRSLVTINKAFNSQLESAKLVPLLVKRAQTLLKENPKVELLSLAVLNVTPDQRVKIAEMLRQFLSTYQISSVQSSETLQTVFKILRLLKISDISLCDSYWTKTLNEIYGTKESNLIYTLYRNIHKYMFFNNNLGGSYRNIEFEKSMIEMVMTEIKKTLIPKDFARFSSFIIAYGDGTGKRQIPQFIVDKIEELNEQLNIKDCMQLSRGVQICLEYNRNIDFLQSQIESINFSLRKAAARHMKTKNLHLSELNSIIRTFNNSRGNYR